MLYTTGEDSGGIHPNTQYANIELLTRCEQTRVVVAVPVPFNVESRAGIDQVVIHLCRVYPTAFNHCTAGTGIA